jgi:hypothetical protein
MPASVSTQKHVRHRHTASMLREAASLRHVSPLSLSTCLQGNIPAVVIIAVDVQDLLALDTENTADASISRPLTGARELP